MSKKQQREPWRNLERHYCQVCNSWMGGDRQSILLHENGKKHQQNLEKSLETRRQDKLESQKKEKLLQSSLQAVERAAAAAHALDPTYAHVATVESTSIQTTAATRVDDTTTAAKKEKEAWQESRKKKREEKKDDNVAPPLPKKKKQLAPDQGHYSHGDTIYLEGSSFSEILEEEMPIQIWTGSGFASLAEKRLPEKNLHWTDGLVVAIRKTSSGTVLDVAYLLSPNDEEETLEKSVNLERIRIVLGADESIPDTLEEARLLVMGEEVTKVETQELSLDENTGLSGWGTVSIRKTTACSELKEERDRQRAKRREEEERAKQVQKEAEAKRMEEAKVENADDSALGAYDVWTSGKGGYKGIDISQEAKLEVQDTAKSLSKGMGSVGFKKKRAKKKENRRTTSADDD